MNYATINELREYLKQLETSAETILPTADAIIGRATAIIRTAIRNELRDPTFDFTAETPPASARLINAGYGVFLTLPPHIIGSLASIVKASSGLTITAYFQHTAPPNYGNVRLLGDPWGTSPALWMGFYSVSAAWGYGVVPANITELCLEIAVDIWRKKDAGFFAEIGVAGEGSLPVVAEWDRLGVISAFVEQYRRVQRYE